MREAFYVASVRSALPAEDKAPGRQLVSSKGAVKPTNALECQGRDIRRNPHWHKSRCIYNRLECMSSGHLDSLLMKRSKHLPPNLYLEQRKHLDRLWIFLDMQQTKGPGPV